MVDSVIKRFAGYFSKKPKQILSIEFGRAFCKIAYFEPGHNKLILKDFILEKATLAEAENDILVRLIKSFLQRNSLIDPYLCLTISDSEFVLLKRLELPSLPESEILSAAQWQLKEDLSFGLKTAIIDWQIIREFSDKDKNKKIEIIFAIANEKVIEKYLIFLSQLGLAPAKISLAPFNYGAILKEIDKVSAVNVVLDVGSHDSTLNVYVEERVRFTRKIPFSSSKMTDDLTGRLVSDKGQVKLDYPEAEQIKCSIGMPDDPNAVIEAKISAMQLISILRPHFELLAKELKRTFDYFTGEFDLASPEKLYLAGGGGSLKNLDKFLAKELSIKVLALPLPESVDSSGVDQAKLTISSFQLLSSFGSVLCGVKGINLLPKEIRAQKSELLQTMSLRLATITVAALFCFAVLVVRFQERDYRVRIANAQAHLETISEVRILAQSILSYDSLVTELQTAKVPVAGLLKVLSNLIPAEVVLDGLDLDQSRSTLALQGQISGGGEVADLVLVQFMQDLEKSSFFIEASLNSSRKQGAAQMFEINCQLKR